MFGIVFEVTARDPGRRGRVTEPAFGEHFGGDIQIEPASCAIAIM